MNSWEFLFEDKILDRGYFITDDVKILNRSSREVNAIVSGTFDYDVKIEFDKHGNIDSMSCTCPYFKRDNCKHLAALLYCLDEYENHDDESDEDFEELFKSVDDERLKEFFLEELRDNWELKNKFLLEFSEKVDENYYKSKLDDIIFEDDFSYMLSSFFRDDIEFLLKKKEYGLILELADDAFITTCQKLECPWNGEYYDNLNDIGEIISSLSNTHISEDVFEWLMSVVRYRFDEDYINIFFEILFSKFKLKYQLEEKYNLVSDIILKSNSYYMESYVMAKIQLMNDLKYLQSDIDEFRQKYLKYPKVRQQFIDEAIEAEDYSKAIKLLKVGIKNSKYSLDKHKVHVQLKELYLKTDDLDSYKKELFQIINKYCEINDYKELKKQYDKKEWIGIREEIFTNCMDTNHFLNECYAYEGLYEHLIKNISYESDLTYYKNRIPYDYSRQLLEKYSFFVNGKVKSTGSRKYYRSIVQILNEMLSINGGEKVVSDILNEWKVKYKNRPAMWDELQRVKI